MLSTTATVTVNAAFFQEIKEDNQELTQRQAALHALCSLPRPIRVSRLRLAHLAAELRDRLALHFALEEAYGYFDDPLSVAPRLCEEAEALRGEHERLFRHLCDLVDEAEELASRTTNDSRAQRRLLDRLRQFCHDLHTHEARENALISAAFNVDIGGGD